MYPKNPLENIPRHYPNKEWRLQIAILIAFSSSTPPSPLISPYFDLVVTNSRYIFYVLCYLKASLVVIRTFSLRIFTQTSMGNYDRLKARNSMHLAARLQATMLLLCNFYAFAGNLKMQRCKERTNVQFFSVC